MPVHNYWEISEYHYDAAISSFNRNKLERNNGIVSRRSYYKLMCRSNLSIAKGYMPVKMLNILFVYDPYIIHPRTRSISEIAGNYWHYSLLPTDYWHNISILFHVLLFISRRRYTYINMIYSLAVTHGLRTRWLRIKLTKWGQIRSYQKIAIDATNAYCCRMCQLEPCAVHHVSAR